MDDLRRLLLIINPVSGTRSKKGLDSRLVKRLASHGFDVDVSFTAQKGDATLLAQKAVAEGYDGVLACGGDGTVNETARAMVGTGVAMGILPAGSGNGLARHIDLPIDAIKAADIIGRRNVRDCDYGTVNGHPFFCTFGLGFDAAVSDRFASAASRGKMTYIRSALSEFLHYKAEPYTIVADGEKIVDDAMLVAVCNANQYGNNAFIAPDASITDGFLDLVVVRKMPKAGTLLMGTKMMAGTLAESSHLVTRKVRNVSVSRQTDGPAHLDGEPFDKAGTRIDIVCHPGALKLFTNDRKQPFKPFLTPLRATVNDMTMSIRHLFSKKGG